MNNQEKQIDEHLFVTNEVFLQQRPMTSCMLSAEYFGKNYVSMGVAMYNPDDICDPRHQWSDVRGKKIARGRALSYIRRTILEQQKIQQENLAVALMLSDPMTMIREAWSNVSAVLALSR